MSNPTLLHVLALVSLSTAARAQEPQSKPPQEEKAKEGVLGQPAPPLAVDNWFNLKGRAKPDLAASLGHPVLIEFWGTSLKPCMKTIPHAQAFHDRYGELGLEVLAVSYDQPDVLQRLIESRGYTIPIGSDGSMKIYQQWHVPEVPSDVLLGKDGHIVYYGAPEACDLAIERELGLESSPTSLFDAYLNAPLEGESESARLELLDRLVAKAPRGFDLREWAARRCDAAPQAADPAHDADALLGEYVEATRAGESERRNAALCALAADGPTSFDLKRWTRAQLAASHPLELAELEDLLNGGRYELALDALLFRAPSAEARERAASDPRFQKHCASATSEARSLARKALIVEYWVFPGVEPTSRARLWADLGIGGPPAGVEAARSFSVGGEHVDPTSIASYVDEELLRFFVASSYASHRAVDAAAFAERVKQERARMLRDLIERHGPVPMAGN